VGRSIRGGRPEGEGRGRGLVSLTRGSIVLDAHCEITVGEEIVGSAGRDFVHAVAGLDSADGDFAGAVLLMDVGRAGRDGRAGTIVDAVGETPLLDEVTKVLLIRVNVTKADPGSCLPVNDAAEKGCRGFVHAGVDVPVARVTICEDEGVVSAVDGRAVRGIDPHLVDVQKLPRSVHVAVWCSIRVGQPLMRSCHFPCHTRGAGTLRPCCETVDRLASGIAAGESLQELPHATMSDVAMFLMQLIQDHGVPFCGKTCGRR
jgi:hypothetical protein